MFKMKHPVLFMVCFVILFAKGKNETTEEKFTRLENALVDVISRVNSMENEKTEVRSQMTDLENENHELRLEMKNLNNENSELQFEVKNLNNENSELRSDMKNLKNEMKDVNDEVKHLKEELEDVNEDIEHLKELSKLLSVRTCDEMQDYGLNKSDYYFVDPDGPLNGEKPIRVYCDFAEYYGFTTKIPHDSEGKIEVTHCHDPGCYSRPIVYDSSIEQIKNLMELSEYCNQLIRYDCYLSPLEEDGVNFGSWVDPNGQDQIYWSGSNYGNHVCSCHFSDEGCISDDILNNTCNCDSKNPAVLFDEGYITNSSALPIMELKFGGMNYESQLGWHTLGRLSCGGKVGDC